MKRIIALLAALLLLTGAALAEDIETDLDNDGIPERVHWEMEAEDEDWEYLVVTVTGEGGEVRYESPIIGSEAVYVEDLDGDGRMELLLTGDVASDDYYTWCLRWEDNQLIELLFPDVDRGENTVGYFTAGYGRIEEINGALTLSGSQDALGTWFASRQVALTPYYRFEIADDGLWTRDPGDFTADTWQYAALTTAMPLEYLAEDGVTMDVLPTGARLIPFATDKQSVVWFITEDGVTGAFTVGPDYERGWGMLVDGVPEEQAFESLPYAD